MTTVDAERLGGLVVDALERIAFLIVEPCDEADLPGPFEATRRARIAITGVGEGAVWLDADDGFVCELAAGLLGCDSDEVDAATTGRDALSELANIVGGLDQKVVLATSVNLDDRRIDAAIDQTVTNGVRAAHGQLFVVGL